MEKQQYGKEKSLPMVSVVTVVYNSKATIEKTIQSVLKQTYANIEYIIIDGNSTDGTQSVIKQYEQNLSFWLSEPDKGVYDAMNKAIDHANSDWICFMNSGDCFHSESVIEDIFGKASYGKEVGVLYGDAHLYNQNDFLGVFPNTPFWQSRFPFYTGKGICHQSMFTRTSIAKALKFDLSYKISADFDMAFKIFKMNYQYQYCPVVVCDFDVNGMSSVSTNWKQTYHEAGRLLGCSHNIFYQLFYYLKWLRKTFQ